MICSKSTKKESSIQPSQGSKNLGTDMTMKYERVVYSFKDVDKPSDPYEINAMVDDFNRIIRMVGRSTADHFEEETRFSVGDLTFVVFKFTWLEPESVDPVKVLEW